MYLSVAQRLVFEGMTMMEVRRLDEAIAIFQQAGNDIKTNLSAPTKMSTCSGINKRPTLALISGDTGPPFTDEGDSYLLPFGFVMKDCNAETDDSSFSEQLAGCAAALLFNLGLCHHLKGFSSNLLTARRMYERAWTCLVRQEPRSSEHVICLQMAICMNLSTCLLDLGDLDNSYN